MNTSLGACLIMCGMIWSYCKYRNIRFELCNNGDDCVVIMNKCDLDRFSTGLDEWFREMGFNMVVEQPVYDIEKIVFCQTQPIRAGPGILEYIMVRDPRSAIPKDSYCIHNISTRKQISSWMNAVGTGGMSLAGQIPVWQEFYRLYQRSSLPGTVGTDWGWGVKKLSLGMVREYGNILPMSRYSFWLAFGISPDEQECIERVYTSMSVELTHDKDTPRYVLLPL